MQLLNKQDPLTEVQTYWKVTWLNSTSLTPEQASLDLQRQTTQTRVYFTVNIIWGKSQNPKIQVQ